MVNYKKCIFLQKYMVHWLDRRIIIFICHKWKYQDIFHKLYSCDSSTLEVSNLYKYRLIKKGGLQGIHNDYLFFDKRKFLDTIDIVLLLDSRN